LDVDVGQKGILDLGFVGQPGYLVALLLEELREFP